MPRTVATLAAVVAFLATAFPRPVRAQAVAFSSPSQQPAGFFGRAVAGISDVSGDARGDLVIGAPNESAAGHPAFAGRAYVLSGTDGALLPTVGPPKEQTAGQFGCRVARVRNAAGPDAIAVGASNEIPDGASVHAGRAYLFSAATGQLLATFSSPNPQEGGAFGASLGGVPDVDGDGVGDVIVGAFKEGPTSPDQTGRAYLFSGATG